MSNKAIGKKIGDTKINAVKENKISNTRLIIFNFNNCVFGYNNSLVNTIIITNI